MQYRCQMSAMAFLLYTVMGSADMSATVNVLIEGDGFHRNFISEISMGDFIDQECNVALHYELPSALYVNVDEVAELRRIGKATACSVGEIDVESFAENAKSQNVTICTSLNAQKVRLAFPVHARYQFARNNGGYVDVTLPKPKLLLGCKTRVKEYRVSKMDLCSPCVDLAMKWREIPYNMIDGDHIWPVPVGDSSHLDKVTYVTLLFTILGAIFIARTIFPQPGSKKTKGD